MAPLDISGRGNGGSRKKDDSKHMLSLNKKLIKPKNSQSSQQSLAYSNPQINQLMGGGALQQDGGVLGDSSQPDSLDKIPSLNFMSVGNNHQ